MATIAIAQNDDIGVAIQEALGHLDVSRHIRGRLVAVKVNDTWASAEDRTAVTQPGTLRAVLRFVRAHGPRQVVVTGGAGAAQTDEVFRVAGLMDIVEEEQAEFFDHNRGPFVEVELPYAPEREVAGPQRSVMVNPRVLEYETLIPVNQLKLHETATVTLGLKNVAMSYPAADYYGHPRHTEEHPNQFFDDMHSFIAAMAKRFPAALSVTTGHPAMLATGPIGGHVVETGLVIASDDWLAADVAGARLLGFNVQGVRHLWEAARLGVGEADLRKAHFPGMSLSEAVRHFTRAAYGRELSFKHA
jgi:uncharacterized protein (DUF362 family)